MRALNQDLVSSRKQWKKKLNVKKKNSGFTHFFFVALFNYWERCLMFIKCLSNVIRWKLIYMLV